MMCLFFYRIGNCVKTFAASTEMLRIAKRFGSGSGHWPLFYGKLRKNLAASTEMLKNVKNFGNAAATGRFF